VRGVRYQQPGRWQQLVLKNVPKELATQVRLLRSTSEAKIDPREAFLDAVVLIVPGEPQGVEVATDDLVVDGIVRSVSNDVEQASYPARADGSSAAPAARSVRAKLSRLADTTNFAARLSEEITVRLHGDMLLVNDKPFLPRALQYQGEPLQYLAERGFNVVWLNRAPSEKETESAKKHNLWFIGRPPAPETLTREGFGKQSDRVIAWFLDDDAIEHDPGYAERWADLVRQHDAVAGRPVIIAPDRSWNSAGKTADVLLASRPHLGFMPNSEYEEWLASRPLLIRAGTPLWAGFPSQFASAVGRQISALSGDATGIPPNVSAPRLQALVDVACSRAMRGFVFHSETALSATDAATRARATGLEVINRRLQRLEPWLASGKISGRFSSADGAWSGIVLHLERAQLLLPVANSTPLALATGHGGKEVGGKEVIFVVPGVPDSCQVFVMTPVALKTLPTQRVAGGTRIVFQPEDDVYVLLTEDPKVVQSLRQHSTRNGESIVRLLRESAALKAAAIAETARRLTETGINNDAAARAAASAAAQLQQVDAGLTSHRVEQAYEAAKTVNRMLEAAADTMRRTVVSQVTRQSNPLAMCDDKLAQFAAFERARPTFQFGDNLLYGGDFEDVGQLTQLGWQHLQNLVPGVESVAELSIEEPRHGNYCLIMQAAAANELRPQLDDATVWIESAPVPVSAGQVVEIAGWARVEPQSRNSGDGLQIVDSLGGPELALTIHETNGWERFEIIRAISEPTELRLTFAFIGLGTTRLDAVMVRPILQQAARRPPNLAPRDGAAASTTPAAAGPILVAPSGTP
jgi:hypothetical protein